MVLLELPDRTGMFGSCVILESKAFWRAVCQRSPSPLPSCQPDLAMAASSAAVLVRLVRGSSGVIGGPRIGTGGMASREVTLREPLCEALRRSTARLLGEGLRLVSWSLWDTILSSSSSSFLSRRTMARLLEVL